MLNPFNRYRHLLLVKSVCILLIAAFVSADLAQAAPVLAKSAATSSLNPKTLSFDPSAAILGETRTHSRGQLILHIQDAHANAGAQKNIAKLLEQAIQQYGVKTVFVEGGSKDNSLTHLRALAPKEIRRRVAGKYLENGDISGPEYLSLASDLDFNLRGIENKDLYRQNLSQYAAAAREREKALSALAEIQKSADSLKAVLYPREIFELDRLLADPNKSFTDLFDRLQDFSRKYSVNLLPYANFLSLKNLKDSSAKADESYIQEVSSIDFPSLLLELEAIREQIYAASLPDPQAVVLYQIDRHLSRLKALFSLKIEPADFQAYLDASEQGRFQPVAMLAFLNRQFYDRNRFENILKYDSSLPSYEKAAVQFYLTAKQRDRAFMENVNRFWKEPVAVVITGGFHTEGLKKLFNKHGFSYAVVSPRVSHETNLKRYEEGLLASSIARFLITEPERGADLMEIREDFSGARLSTAKFSNSATVAEESQVAEPRKSTGHLFNAIAVTAMAAVFYGLNLAPGKVNDWMSAADVSVWLTQNLVTFVSFGVVSDSLTKRSVGEKITRHSMIGAAKAGVGNTLAVLCYFAISDAMFSPLLYLTMVPGIDWVAAFMKGTLQAFVLGPVRNKLIAKYFHTANKEQKSAGIERRRHESLWLSRGHGISINSLIQYLPLWIRLWAEAVKNQWFSHYFVYANHAPYDTLIARPHWVESLEKTVSHGFFKIPFAFINFFILPFKWGLGKLNIKIELIGPKEAALILYGLPASAIVTFKTIQGLRIRQASGARLSKWPENAYSALLGDDALTKAEFDERFKDLTRKHKMEERFRAYLHHLKSKGFLIATDESLEDMELVAFGSYFWRSPFETQADLDVFAFVKGEAVVRQKSQARFYLSDGTKCDWQLVADSYNGKKYSPVELTHRLVESGVPMSAHRSEAKRWIVDLTDAQRFERASYLLEQALTEYGLSDELSHPRKIWKRAFNAYISFRPLAVRAFSENSVQDFERRELFDGQTAHEFYRRLYLGQAALPWVIGSREQLLDFKMAVQRYLKKTKLAEEREAEAVAMPAAARLAGTDYKKELREQHLFKHIDGVGIVSTVHVLDESGVFEILQSAEQTGRPISAREIIGELKYRRKKRGLGQRVNEGYLLVALHAMCLQGWFEREGAPDSLDSTYKITPEGKIGIEYASIYSAAMQFTEPAAHMDAFLFEKSPRGPPAEKKDYTDSFYRLVEQSRNDWGLPKNMDAQVREKILRQLDGYLIAPALLALRDRNDEGWIRINDEEPAASPRALTRFAGRVLEKLEKFPALQKLTRSFFISAGWIASYDEPFDISKINGNTGRLRLVMDLLVKQGWVNHGGGNTYQFNAKGKYIFDLAWSYGVPVSYLPLYSKLDQLIFGDPVKVFTRDSLGHETHVNRPLNVKGSGAAHRGYFKELRKMIIDVFDPKHGSNRPKVVSDMGAGDGSFLKFIHETIQTVDPNYQVHFVAADYNAEARALAERKLLRAGIDPKYIHTIHADINDLARYRVDLSSELAKSGIETTDVMHVSSMLVHNRPIKLDRSTDASFTAEQKTQAAFVTEEGEIIPGNWLTQNLIEHFLSWKKLTEGSSHPIFLIELHTIQPSAAKDTLAIAYYTSHGYSNQVNVEASVVDFAMRRAGFAAAPKSFPPNKTGAIDAKTAVTVSRLTPSTRTPVPSGARLADVRSADQTEEIADEIYQDFSKYYGKYLENTDRAKISFETRDWRRVAQDAEERIGLYPNSLDLIQKKVAAALGDQALDRDVWLSLKEVYKRKTAGIYEADLALTYFYSVMRRNFVGTDISVEYTDDGITPRKVTNGNLIYSTYRINGSLKDLIKQIMQGRFDAPYKDLDDDAAIAAKILDRDLPPNSLNSIEVLKPIFYRNKGAYIIGRVRSQGKVIPVIFALLNGPEGITIDAVLTDEDSASNIFSYVRSNFHVDTRHYRELVRFLGSILRDRGRSSLYSAVGFIHPSKIEMIRELRKHIWDYDEQWAPTKGQKGWVMATAMMPSFPFILKVISDTSNKEGFSKTNVEKQYKRVHRTDRAGRMLDAVVYTDLHFQKTQFTPELLAELKARAPSEIKEADDEIIIKKAYIMRKVVPLDYYISTHADKPDEIKRVLVDWGYCIKDLAAANLWPGDFKIKNFGVTKSGKVVSYDYDELDIITWLNFKERNTSFYIPAAEGESYFDDSDWRDRHRYNIIYLEKEFRDTEIPNQYLKYFKDAHPDLYQPEFWEGIKAQLLKGELPDVYAYHESKRLEYFRKSAARLPAIAGAELLKALNLPGTTIAASEERPLTENSPFRIRRVKETENGFLSRELSDLQTDLFDLLVDSQNGHVIAVFPVQTGDSKVPPKFLDLSPYYWKIPKENYDPATLFSAWEDYKPAFQGAKQAIEEYQKQNAFGDKRARFINLSPEPFFYLEIDKASGLASASSVYLENAWNDQQIRVDALPEPNQNKYQIVIPVYPTVYPPIPEGDLDYYYYLWGADLNLKAGEDVCIKGPGSGADAWTAWLKTGHKVAAVGVNPMEIANLHATARIAGFEVDTRIGDKIIRSDGVNPFGRRFDKVIWNAAWYQPIQTKPEEIWYEDFDGNAFMRQNLPKPLSEQKNEAKRSLRDHWDRDYDGADLTWFAKSELPELLNQSGKALIWNTRDEDVTFILNLSKMRVRELLPLYTKNGSQVYLLAMDPADGRTPGTAHAIENAFFTAAEAGARLAQAELEAIRDLWPPVKGREQTFEKEYDREIKFWVKFRRDDKSLPLDFSKIRVYLTHNDPEDHGSGDRWTQNPWKTTEAFRYEDGEDGDSFHYYAVLPKGVQRYNIFVSIDGQTQAMQLPGWDELEWWDHHVVVKAPETFISRVLHVRELALRALSGLRQISHHRNPKFAAVVRPVIAQINSVLPAGAPKIVAVIFWGDTTSFDRDSLSYVHYIIVTDKPFENPQNVSETFEQAQFDIQFREKLTAALNESYKQPISHSPPLVRLVRKGYWVETPEGEPSKNPDLEDWIKRAVLHLEKVRPTGLFIPDVEAKNLTLLSGNLGDEMRLAAKFQNRIHAVAQSAEPASGARLAEKKLKQALRGVPAYTPAESEASKPWLEKFSSVYREVREAFGAKATVEAFVSIWADMAGLDNWDEASHMFAALHWSDLLDEEIQELLKFKDKRFFNERFHSPDVQRTYAAFAIALDKLLKQRDSDLSSGERGSFAQAGARLAGFIKIALPPTIREKRIHKIIDNNRFTSAWANFDGPLNPERVEVFLHCKTGLSADEWRSVPARIDRWADNNASFHFETQIPENTTEYTWYVTVRKSATDESPEKFWLGKPNENVKVEEALKSLPTISSLPLPTSDVGTNRMLQREVYHLHVSKRIKNDLKEGRFTRVEYDPKTGHFGLKVVGKSAQKTDPVIQRIRELNENEAFIAWVRGYRGPKDNLSITLVEAEPKSTSKTASFPHMLYAEGSDFLAALSKTEKGSGQMVWMTRDGFTGFDQRIVTEILKNQIELSGALCAYAREDKPRPPRASGGKTALASLQTQIRQSEQGASDISRTKAYEARMSANFERLEQLTKEVLAVFDGIRKQLPKSAPATTNFHRLKKVRAAIKRHDFDTAIYHWGLMTYAIADMAHISSGMPQQYQDEIKVFLTMLKLSEATKKMEKIQSNFISYINGENVVRPKNGTETAPDRGISNLKGEWEGAVIGTARVIKDISEIDKEFRKAQAAGDHSTIWVVPYLPDRYLEVPGGGMITGVMSGAHALDAAKEQGMPYAIIPDATKLLGGYDGKRCLLRVEGRDVRFRMAVAEDQSVPAKSLKGKIRLPKPRTDGPLRLNLDLVDETTVCLTGFKAGDLGTLRRLSHRSNAAFKVPDGFVLTFSFWEKFKEQNALGPVIEEAMSRIKTQPVIKRGVSDNGLLIDMSAEEMDAVLNPLRQAISQAKFSHDLTEEVRQGIDELCARNGGYGPVDLNQILSQIKHVFSSAYNPKPVAMMFRYPDSFAGHRTTPAVLVQLPVQAEYAGTMRTMKATSDQADRNVLVVKASYGQGAAVVGDLGQPAEIEINKMDKSKAVVQKESYIDGYYRIRKGRFPLYTRSTMHSEDTRKMLTPGFFDSAPEKPQVGDTQSPLELAAVSAQMRERPIFGTHAKDLDLPDKLHAAAEQVEGAFRFRPQDIEWVCDAEGQIWIVQSRSLKTDPWYAEHLIDEAVLDYLEHVSGNTIYELHLNLSNKSPAAADRLIDALALNRELPSSPSEKKALLGLRYVASKILSDYVEHPLAANHFSAKQVNAITLYLTKNAKFLAIYPGAENLLMFLRKLADAHPDPEVRNSIDGFFRSFLHQKISYHNINFEIANYFINRNEFEDLISNDETAKFKPAAPNKDYPDICDRTLRFLDRMPLPFMASCLKTYREDPRLAEWIRNYAERIYYRHADDVVVPNSSASRPTDHSNGQKSHVVTFPSLTRFLKPKDWMRSSEDLSIARMKSGHLSGKRVLVRVDLDVRLNANGNLSDKKRLLSWKKLVNILHEKGAIVILLGYNHDPKSSNAFEAIETYMEKVYPETDIAFHYGSIGPEGLEKGMDKSLFGTRPGRRAIHVLGNLRSIPNFEEWPEEKKFNFAKSLAALTDGVFVFGDVMALDRDRIFTKRFPDVFKEIYIGPEVADRFRLEASESSDEATEVDGARLVSKSITVTLKWGLHLRPSSRIAELMRDFPDHKTTIRNADGVVADASDVISLMMLGALSQDQLYVEVEGDRAQELFSRLESIISPASVSAQEEGARLAQATKLVRTEDWALSIQVEREEPGGDLLITFHMSEQYARFQGATVRSLDHQVRLKAESTIDLEGFAAQIQKLAQSERWLSLEGRPKGILTTLAARALSLAQRSANPAVSVNPSSGARLAMDRRQFLKSALTGAAAIRLAGFSQFAHADEKGASVKELMAGLSGKPDKESVIHDVQAILQWAKTNKYPDAHVIDLYLPYVAKAGVLDPKANLLVGASKTLAASGDMVVELNCERISEDIRLCKAAGEGSENLFAQTVLIDTLREAHGAYMMLAQKEETQKIGTQLEEINKEFQAAANMQSQLDIVEKHAGVLRRHVGREIGGEVYEIEQEYGALVWLSKNGHYQSKKVDELVNGPKAKEVETVLRRAGSTAFLQFGQTVDDWTRGYMWQFIYLGMVSYSQTGEIREHSNKVLLTLLAIRDFQKSKGKNGVDPKHINQLIKEANFPPGALDNLTRPIEIEIRKYLEDMKAKDDARSKSEDKKSGARLSAAAPTPKDEKLLDESDDWGEELVRHELNFGNESEKKQDDIREAGEAGARMALAPEFAKRTGKFPMLFAGIVALFTLSLPNAEAKEPNVTMQSISVEALNNDFSFDALPSVILSQGHLPTPKAGKIVKSWADDEAALKAFVQMMAKAFAKPGFENGGTLPVPMELFIDAQGNLKNQAGLSDITQILNNALAFQPVKGKSVRIVLCGEAGDAQTAKIQKNLEKISQGSVRFELDASADLATLEQKEKDLYGLVYSQAQGARLAFSKDMPYVEAEADEIGDAFAPFAVLFALYLSVDRDASGLTPELKAMIRASGNKFRLLPPAKSFGARLALRLLAIQSTEVAA